MAPMWLRFALIGLIAMSGTASARVAAATYFVDFEGGSDTATGLAPADAWKRAPGDSRAGPVPRLTRLQPGDRVLFRGGTRYRGTVVVRAAGTADAPIRYLGDGWGDGRATVDGSEPVEAMRACRSERDCGGEADWRELLRVRLPERSLAWDGLFQGERALRLVAGSGTLSFGEARVLPQSGGQEILVRPWPGQPHQFARGAARVGFLLLAGGHVEIRGFHLARFTPAPRKGPYAGAPVVQLQPLAGILLAGLQPGPEAGPIPLMAPPPVRAMAGVTSGPT